MILLSPLEAAVDAAPSDQVIVQKADQQALLAELRRVYGLLGLRNCDAGVAAFCDDVRGGANA